MRYQILLAGDPVQNNRWAEEIYKLLNLRPKKRENKITTIDFIFVLIFIVLFVVVLLDFYGIRIQFFFEQSILGTSIFGFFSGILILYYSILWGCLKMKDHFKRKEGFKIVITKAFRFVGFIKPSRKGAVYIAFGVLVGAMFNLLSLLLMNYSFNGILRWTQPSDPQIILQNFIVAPIFEELIYRGIYLSAFMRIFGKNYIMAIIATTLSSFTFGWIHPTMPILKTLAGLLLGCIYLFKWKKNIFASMFAHLGANAVATFLTVEVPL